MNQNWHISLALLKQFLLLHFALFLYSILVLRAARNLLSNGMLWLNQWFVRSVKKYTLFGSNTKKIFWCVMNASWHVAIQFISLLSVLCWFWIKLHIHTSNFMGRRVQNNHIWDDGFFCCCCCFYLFLSLSLLLVFDFITHRSACAARRFQCTAAHENCLIVIHCHYKQVIILCALCDFIVVSYCCW